MNSTTTKTPGKTKAFTERDRSGILFYDSVGAPTLSGRIKEGKEYAVTAEPAVDKNQREYLKLTGDGVTGALYPNDRKTAENHPDRTGPVKIGGKELRVSAWTRKIKTGEREGQDYYSLAISDPYRPD